MDWKTASQYVDRENRMELFELLIYLQRHEEALAVINLGTSFDERLVWFERRSRNLKSLQDKISRLDTRDQDSDSARTDFNQTWRLCLSAVDELSSLGFTDQALVFYRILFETANEFESSLDERIAILAGLLSLDRHDEIWNLIDIGFSENEFNYVATQIFPGKQTVARYWFTNFSKRYPQPLHRLQRVSSMIRSPLEDAIETEAAVDVDAELSLTRSEIPLNNSGFEFMTAQTLDLHGRNEEVLSHLALAVDMGNQPAQTRLATFQLASQNFATAADLFDLAGKTQNSTSNSLLAAEAHRRQGNHKEAALRETLAFVNWYESYRRDAFVNSMRELDKFDRMANFFRVVSSVSGSTRNSGPVSNETYRALLAESTSETSPRFSASCFQIHLLNFFSTDDPSNSNFIFAAELSRNAFIASATADIAEGNLDKALSRLIQFNDLRPGDPEIGEKLISLLDGAGATALADELFLEVTEFYIETLKRYPLSPLHHNNYAWICACARRRLEFALRHAETAVAQRPATTSYIDTLGEVYFLTGQTGKAIEFGQRCLQINPVKAHYQQQLKRYLDR